MVAPCQNNLNVWAIHHKYNITEQVMFMHKNCFIIDILDIYTEVMVDQKKGNNLKPFLATKQINKESAAGRSACKGMHLQHTTGMQEPVNQ